MWTTGDNILAICLAQKQRKSPVCIRHIAKFFAPAALDSMQIPYVSVAESQKFSRAPRGKYRFLYFWRKLSFFGRFLFFRRKWPKILGSYYLTNLPKRSSYFLEEHDRNFPVLIFYRNQFLFFRRQWPKFRGGSY